jgi:hypothetical protein
MLQRIIIEILISILAAVVVELFMDKYRRDKARIKLSWSV